MDLRRIAMIMVQALLMIGVRASDIRTYPLDEHSIYTIRLNRAEPTTCVFPAPIKAMVGANVSSKTEDEPGILLSHKPGTDYFSLRPLKDDATGALNIVLGKKVYALAFVPGQEPDRAVVFLDEPIATGPRNNETTLRALIERARQLDRGAPPVPGMASRCQRARPGNPTHYRAFTATVESVVRFEAEDALVFRIKLENTIDAPVQYDPQGLAIRLGRELFPALVSDASGAIPPRGVSHVYFAIAGAPGGGRANLSVHEQFSVIVPHP